MATKKKRNSFRDRVTANAHRQKTQGAQYGYLNLPNGVHIFKEEIGMKARIDFVPYTVTDPGHPDRDDDAGIAVPGELWYKRPYKVHRNVGVENDAAVCPTSIGKKCPICEFHQKRIRENADKEEVRQLKASRRNLYIVVPRDMKKFDEEPHIWDISQFNFQKNLNDELEENPEYGAFPDADEGYTVRIRFTEASVGANKFAETSRIDFDERSEALEDEIVNAAPNLDEMLNILSYEELRKKFYEEDEPESDEVKATSRKRGRGGDEDDDEDDEDDKKERARKDRRRATRKGEEEEEDEEEDEDDKRRSTSKKGKEAGGRRREKEPKGKAGKKKGGEDGCPHGYEFGVDTDEYKECDKCELWDACMDAKENAA